MNYLTILLVFLFLIFWFSVVLIVLFCWTSHCLFGCEWEYLFNKNKKAYIRKCEYCKKREYKINGKWIN